MGWSGEVEQTNISRRFEVVGQRDTVLTQNEGDGRHGQQSPICSLKSSANTADSCHCKPIPYLSLTLTDNVDGTLLSCSIVDL